MELIRANHIVKRQNQAFTLGPVDFNLHAGEVLGVAGEPGSGKTTLLRLIWGFLRPDEGMLSVFCLKPHLNQISVRRHAGYLPESRKFDGGMTARQHVHGASHFYEGWDESAANLMLHRFGIDPEGRVDKLSTGPRIKLALISAAGHNPALLLLDDPMAGLNPPVREEISEIVKTLARERETGIVVSSRRTRDLEHCADSILTLKAGRISRDRPTSRLLLR